MLSCCALNSMAQELNAKVVVNSSKIQGVAKEVFTEIESSVTYLLNDTKWSNFDYKQNEKIECTFSIVINSVESNTKFIGEIQVTSRRPVYNSSYTTALFNFRDVELTFDYLQGQTLSYVQNSVNDNLVGVISFYAYVLLGLDADSFALGGGKPYFETAMSIANSAQSSTSTSGWGAFASDKNRYALALALTEESSKDFHTLWYNYHRKGLDEMAANASRGRIQVYETLTSLDNLYQARPSSALLLMYGDTKLSELIDILMQATSEEKKEAMTILNKIYPSKGSIINRLKS